MVSVFSDGAFTAKLDRWNDAVGDRYNRLKETDGSRRVALIWKLGPWVRVE